MIMSKINFIEIKYTSIKCSIISAILIALLISCRGDLQNAKEKKSSAGNSSGQSERLDWFKEAKFGMFIHWGPYSQLAGEWNGRQVTVGENAEWIMQKLKIPVAEYRELAHSFNPVLFDAQKWVRLAKATGMKYIVITAKHHDGFAMYQSKVTSYNIADWTPFNRDPLKELSEACAEEGIRFCVYYSHREDWDHPGGYGNNWDYDNEWGSNFYDRDKFEKYLDEKAKPQLRELLTNYGPIGLVWFDRGMYTPEQGRDFVDLVHDLQPQTLINGRVGNYDQEFLGDYQSMGDNGMPPGGVEEYWETPMTLNKTWGFSKFDTLWKSSATVIQRLVEIVSRGGNYLLNIGPRGDGEIPDATIEIFSEVGPWVERNAESIYGTTSNPFGELSWGYCSVKENRLFLFVREWPADGQIILPGLQNNVMSACLLIDKAKKLPVSTSDKGVSISLPEKAPDHPISVILVETDGSPKVNPPAAFADKSGVIELNYLTAITNGRTMTRFNRKGGFHISKWTGPEDAVEWNLNIDKPGKFKMIIDYAANEDWEGQQYEVIIADTKITKSVIYTGDWYEYQEFPIGYVELPEKGEYSLTLRPKMSGDKYLMYLRSLKLEPVSSIKKEGWGAD